jgi:D-beta-D-heptose 7-phosphate kinase/D-beta-D-heptose 1-phosphate adenosyltransferase
MTTLTTIAIPKILLIGDSCTDQTIWGRCHRLSPEAPVPVFVPESESQTSGMAGNVLNNLERLGSDVTFYTNPENITKTRYTDIQSRQQLIRVDVEPEVEPWICDTDADYADYDAIVISDYAKGFVTTAAIRSLRRQFSGPVFVDTKITDLTQLEGCTVKINEPEYKRLTSECSDLVVTLGAAGVRYAGTTYPAPAVEVYDVCGAGDTFLAALSWHYVQHTDMVTAIAFAQAAASITVQHAGVYAPGLSEIDIALDK